MTQNKLLQWDLIQGSNCVLCNLDYGLPVWVQQRTSPIVRMQQGTRPATNPNLLLSPAICSISNPRPPPVPPPPNRPITSRISVFEDLSANEVEDVYYDDNNGGGRGGNEEGCGGYNRGNRGHGGHGGGHGGNEGGSPWRRAGGQDSWLFCSQWQIELGRTPTFWIVSANGVEDVNYDDNNGGGFGVYGEGHGGYNLGNGGGGGNGGGSHGGAGP
ncbi:hypothetical protein FRX31_005864 [Thalictrum thalictroides]|uniref:Uncharacterized protein n=1 Tax=Thalictrum thalictroides TaxID=46969 RepID=A0A7J6X7L2_THATH|nr:hypothetical protein FRX31_005864 [Thalictrum thalictroides]